MHGGAELGIVAAVAGNEAAQDALADQPARQHPVLVDLGRALVDPRHPLVVVPVRERMLVGAAAGAVQLEIGIQSFTKAVLQNISRPQNIAKIADNLSYLRQHTGVHVHADLIFGLPGETLEPFAASFDQLLSLGPDEIQLGFLKRLRGTPIIRHTEPAALRFSPRPARSKVVRKYFFEANLDYIINDTNTDLQSRQVQGAFRVDLQSGDQIEANINANAEALTSTFEISKGVFLPVGEYAFTDVDALYRLGPQRRIGGDARDLASQVGLVVGQQQRAHQPAARPIILGVHGHLPDRLASEYQRASIRAEHACGGPAWPPQAMRTVYHRSAAGKLGGCIIAHMFFISIALGLT